MKLTAVPRAFYNGTLHLHDQNITGAALKTAFHKRFKDMRTDQYNFTQLQMAKQKKDKSPQEFADRYSGLAQQSTQNFEYTVLQ
jgi:hypothetical protein